MCSLGYISPILFLNMCFFNMFKYVIVLFKYIVRESILNNSSQKLVGDIDLGDIVN